MTSADGTKDRLVGAVRRAKRTRSARALAALGLASRAIVYGALAVLVVQFAVTGRPRDTDQGSALVRLGRVFGGPVLLVVLLVGVVSYSLWRWSEAIAGQADGDRRIRTRLLAIVEGAAYLPFAYLAAVILIGDPSDARQGPQYRTLSARILHTTSGQVLVVTIGLVVAGVGVFFVVQGAKQTFAAQFDFPQHRPWVRHTVLALGTIGSVARGLIFVETGALVTYAALARDPDDAGGFDSALDKLAQQPYGTALLLIAAAGFTAFAIFALAEAVWRER